MRTGAFSWLLSLSVRRVSMGASICASLCVGGCSDDDGAALGRPRPAPTTNESTQPAPAPTPPVPTDDPGPAPAGCGTIAKDKSGFFTRKTEQSSYVGFVPESYSGKPTTLVVGMHGCGDTAMNFATWGVNPSDTRRAQHHIGISIGGKDDQCWDASTDIDKVVAAIEDVSKCFYVHQKKVVLAGFSSGGLLAYKLGLTQSARFAGIIVQNSGLGGTKPSAASWKLNVAHIAHKSDEVFPLSRVQVDWASLEAAGIPLSKTVVDGTHDGTSDDWAAFLLPKIASWKAP